MKDVGQEQTMSNEQLEDAEVDLSTPNSSPRSRHSKSKLENHKGFPSPTGRAQTGYLSEPKKPLPSEASQTASAKKTVKETQLTLLNFFSKPEQPLFPFVLPKSSTPPVGTDSLRRLPGSGSAGVGRTNDGQGLHDGRDLRERDWNAHGHVWFHGSSENRADKREALDHRLPDSSSNPGFQNWRSTVQHSCSLPQLVDAMKAANASQNETIV
eukprot:1440466-Rhodomonas_salina.1